MSGFGWFDIMDKNSIVGYWVYKVFFELII